MERHDLPRALVLCAILLLASNARTGVGVLSPIVEVVDRDVPLDTLVLSVIGALPMACFAVFGMITPRLVRWRGMELAGGIGLGLVLIGHLTRALAIDPPMMVIGTVLIFAGGGIGNVLIPPLVKKYFARRPSLVSILYLGVMGVSGAIPALTAVPIAEAVGWRFTLGVWASFTLMAAAPWIPLIARNARRAPIVDLAIVSMATERTGRLFRSKTAWAMVVLFAASSVNSYSMLAWMPLFLHDAGLESGTAGGMLAIYAGTGLPAGVLVPLLASKLRHPVLIAYVAGGCFLVGYTGLILMPTTGTPVWVLLGGLGTSMFPLVMVLVNMKTHTHLGSVALSGFVQGVGYVIATAGPITVGLLHSITGTWAVGILFLLGVGLGGAAAGHIAIRGPNLEEGEVLASG